MRGLYALPAGADFARDFVAGLLARFRDQPPEALAEVTLWLNAERTLRAMREAFDEKGPLLLPQMRLIADLGRSPDEMSPVGRMLDLAQLIDAMATREPGLMAGQSLPALAESLAALMTEMQLEACGPDALEAVDTGQHAAHWQRALKFLRIAVDAMLEGTPKDRAAGQRAAAEALAAAWTAGRDLPKGPVIVAGSTGSHGATRLFMRAIAQLPQGAVVLPGFDFDQPPEIWENLAQSHGEEHPQARFAPLVAEFGLPRPWAESAFDRSRNRLVSLALRPAPVTDQWVAEGPALGDLIGATSALSLIEADHPQAEAEAIAIAMREAVEAGESVTLLAADRGLTRRVTAALDCWRLIPDDSAGRPLALTPTGLLLRAVAGLNGRALAVDGLLALLKNRRVSGADPGDHLRHTRDLELWLRAHGPAFPDADFLREWGEKAPDRELWADWLADILTRIAPLAEDRAPRPVPDRLKALCNLAEALAAGPSGDSQALWSGEEGPPIRAVIDALHQAARPGHQMQPHDFAALISGQLGQKALTAEPGAHPLIRIRGPREARTDAVGLVILAGLNEGEWPQALPPDPWLSRAMRLQAGLTLPERQTGLSAHDFQQGLMAERVILSRAYRNAEAETIPSRWLNRLLNLLGGLPEQRGQEALAAMRARGGRWLDLAAALAQPRDAVRKANPPTPRPSPIPPVQALREISVTQVSTLIRDPYSIYASRILRLYPLNPLAPRPDDPRLRGILLHKIAEAVTKSIGAIGPDAGALQDNLRRIAHENLELLVPWPAERIFLAARIDAIAAQLAADDAARLTHQRPVVVEKAGGAPLPLSGMRLTARPDRLDSHDDGRVSIYDYKSGKPPSVKQVERFDKQLPLTAALALQGAFPGFDPAGLAEVAYIHLGGDGQTVIHDVTAEMARDEWTRLDHLLQHYQSGAKGFTALRAIEAVGWAGDYAHLARFGEWGLSDPPQPEKVGDRGPDDMGGGT